MSKNSSSKPVVLLATVILLLAGIAWFMSSNEETPVSSPKSDTSAKAKVAEPAKPAPKAVTSTQAAAINEQAEQVEKVAPPSEDSEPSEMRETADPNDEPDNALAGISYRDVDMWELESFKLPEKLKGGVLISKIHAKSSFAESQVMPGDIVTRAHHTKVVTFTDLENAVKDRTHTLLDLYRNGKPYQVVLNKPFNPK